MTFEERNRLLTTAKPLTLTSGQLPYVVAVVGIVIAFAAAPIIRKKLKKRKR